jgi:hypothetical protein
MLPATDHSAKYSANYPINHSANHSADHSANHSAMEVNKYVMQPPDVPQQTAASNVRAGAGRANGGECPSIQEIIVALGEFPTVDEIAAAVTAVDSCDCPTLERIVEAINNALIS